LFTKKDKLACGTTLINVVDPLLDHVACAETTKDSWNNLCATLEKKNMLATNYNYIKSFIILRWRKVF
jgi:hypothetical protein